MGYRNREPWKGAIAGMVGGVVGTLLLDGYWKVLNAVLGKDLREQKSDGPGALDDMALGPKIRRPGESSTAAVGRIAYETASGEPPGRGRKEDLAQAVHWSYGIAQGVIYGALRGEARPPDPTGGALFGTALWGFSELGLPALGLARGPTAQPPSSHVAQLGAHLVYGLAASTVTQFVRNTF